VNNITEISDKTKSEIRAYLSDRILERYKKYQGVSEKEVLQGTYGDVIGRSYYYLGQEDKAIHYLTEAAHLCHKHFQRFEEKSKDFYEQHKGTWREPKPSNSYLDIISYLRPAWWVDLDTAEKWLYEALDFSSKAISHHMEHEQYWALTFIYYLYLLLGNHKQAYQSSIDRIAWLESHDFVIDDPGDLIGLSRDAAFALMKEDEEKILSTYDRINIYMRRSHSLIYGQNPSNVLLIFEVIRRRIMSGKKTV
jgi:hypothetical protein